MKMTDSKEESVSGLIAKVNKKGKLRAKNPVRMKDLLAQVYVTGVKSRVISRRIAIGSRST